MFDDSSALADTPRTAGTCELRSELPEYLLRGVPSNGAFQGYGRHFKSLAGGANDFSLSMPTECIDDFISHDWRTPRIVKYVALSYIYNSNAALIGSTVIAGLVVSTREILRYTDSWHPALDKGLLFPDKLGFLSIGPIVYLVLLFHWQSILARLGTAPLLFVDKLCIAQNDEDLKSQGVHGLAAFLKQTRRIVVLWSPGYFSRLWCTYELAAWFRFEREMSSVLFVPVAIPAKLVCGFLILAIGCLSAQTSLVAASKTRLDPGALFTALLVASIVGTYILQGQMLHVAELRQQLEEFRMQQTSCFCCSNNHVHPESGAPLACDREMVYSTLKRWSDCEEDIEDVEAHLSNFNEEVRTSLRRYVTSSLPEHRLFLRYIDLVHIAFPYFWFTIDYVLYRVSLGERDLQLMLYVIEGLCYMLLTIPLALSFVFRMMHLARPLKTYIEGSVAKRILLAFCFWGPLCSVSVAFLMAFDSSDVYKELGSNCGWLLLIPVTIKAFVAYKVFARETRTKDYPTGSFSLGKRSTTDSEPAAPLHVEQTGEAAGAGEAPPAAAHEVADAKEEV
eukprot:TRINITY_DN13503_c0_g1_i1.p1 TRINITY_DN13503_c0_g1~~TRINITY_DN13503_c0_g1_i1.p1  ORF type:complete len:564 (-),score=74.58 TRINITY_DN13503_c0_g1_i1:384-2075(-)